jgi:peptidoglycan/xylan/chitin deacetylase (PgdA/CDA1 family)
MSEQGVVFLMYHELEVTGRSLCQPDAGYSRYVVAETDFRCQIRWLQQAGWRGMNVSEALASESQDGGERSSIAITFDDGWESDLIAAVPIMKEAGYNATFYVTVGFVGQPGYMSPTQIRELSVLGYEVGCHSMTHAYLTNLDERGLHREMAEAKTHLEDILGKPVEHFSCPGGRYNKRVMQAAREAGYRSLTNSRIHGNTPTTDPFALGRIAILRETELRVFQSICRGEGFWKIQLRERLQNAAKSMLGNSLYDRCRALLLR